MWKKNGEKLRIFKLKNGEKLRIFKLKYLMNIEKVIYV